MEGREPRDRGKAEIGKLEIGKGRFLTNRRERSAQRMNSREKGKRGERQWRDELRANGYAARRGQQFSGSPESPDVICDGLPWAHFEVKLTERLDIYAAMDQAQRDCSGKAAFVAHRRNYRPWLVTMDAERFYRLLQADMSGRWAETLAGLAPDEACARFAWLHCATHEGRLNLYEAMATALDHGLRDHGLRDHGLRDSGTGKRSEVGGQRSEVGGQRSEVGGQRSEKVAVVAHRRAGGRWLITLAAESFFSFLRGALPPEGK
jgi:Holliday junction resolvase